MWLQEGIHNPDAEQLARDSGIDVSVGLRKDGESWGKAKATGLDVVEVDELVKKSDIIIIL